jgi:hypothetical protein
MKYLSLFLMLSITFFLNICCNNENPKNEKQTKIETYSRNIDTLKTLINLEKYAPVNVMWKISYPGKNPEERALCPGPTDYVLEAVLQFDRTTADQIRNDYKIKSTTYKQIDINDFWFKWLPKELKIKVENKASQVFNPDYFVKNSLMNGNFVFLNMNTIMLKLYTS